MTEETIQTAIEMLNETRNRCGCHSDVYIECLDFFSCLYYTDTNYKDYKRVLYNPITKTHELS